MSATLNRHTAPLTCRRTHRGLDAIRAERGFKIDMFIIVFP
jgi:hypothetical protein